MAKSSTCNISIRMDSNLKAAAEALYEELGMNLSTAFNIFVRQSLRERGIPFKITEGTPSKETVSAMLEAERIAKDPTVKGYHDVDEFFDVLREDPLDQWYEIGNVIAILDARLEKNLSQQADYLLASEAANAGKVILSHADAATREQCEDTVAHLNRALEQIRCDRRIDPEKDILQKNLTDLTKEDLEEVSKCGYRLESYRKIDLENEQSFDSLFFMEEKITSEALERAVPRLFADKSCGEVFRIKGFVKNKDGQWMELNATHDSRTLDPIAVGQEVLIVIGEHLQEDKIREILKEEETCQS